MRDTVRETRASRLAFGPPRKEDMLAVMHSKGGGEVKLAREMRTDLMLDLALERTASPVNNFCVDDVILNAGALRRGRPLVT